MSTYNLRWFNTKSVSARGNRLTWGDPSHTNSVLSRHPRFGVGNRQHWEEGVGGLGAVPPAGSRGRVPGQSVWGQSPPSPEAGSFLLHKWLIFVYT